MDTDLADYVDFPRETLDVELKQWIDLTDGVAKAKIARHLAALANHGGGYLIFGFNDDLTRALDRPTDLGHFNRDEFTSIVKRYLTPAFQCEVTLVKASDGLIFPVVRVPPHGAVPIAAKTDGPNDPKGRPQGIVSGSYYIRKPGPESAPIRGPEEWQPIIRRCVLNDRGALLREIASVVQPGSIQGQPAAEDHLATWHKLSDQRYLDLTRKAQDLEWPVAIANNRCQLSYLIVAVDGEALPRESTVQILEEVNVQVRGTVWTGWSMFYPFTRPEIAPAWHPEREDGTGADVLEGDLLGDGTFDTSLPDYWRFTPDGRATIIRPYREDRPRTVAANGKAAGTWMSPETVIRETTELVTHARLMAERFETATSIAFRCSWLGLAGRQIDDFDGIYWSPGRIAKAGHRTTQGEWSLAALAGNWPTIVADLACPVLSLFGFDQCGADLVNGLAPRFRKL
jgi:hypothetical protein